MSINGVPLLLLLPLLLIFINISHSALEQQAFRGIASEQEETKSFDHVNTTNVVQDATTRREIGRRRKDNGHARKAHRKHAKESTGAENRVGNLESTLREMEELKKKHYKKKRLFKNAGNDTFKHHKHAKNENKKDREKQDANKDEKVEDELDQNNDSEHSDGGWLKHETLKSLRNALLVHPFQVWKFKGRFESMMDLGVHEAQLQSIVENKWHSTRMEAKLDKVLKGEDVHLAILGGSNSVGGGIQEDEGDTSRVFYRVISDWWRKVVLPITGSHLKIRQASIGGTASDFFQYCYQNFIQENVDIVLLELAVNDLKQLPASVNLSLPIEQLTRELLQFHTEPAVLYLNLFSGRTYYQGCTNLEDFGQGLLSDVYNITTFSWRDAVCPKVMGKYRTPLQSCHVVCKDGHHINLRGHAHISLMIINLFRDLLLKKMIEGTKGTTKRNSELPAPVFIHDNKVITEPRCWTSLTPNYLKFKMHNSMNVGVMENYGFDFLREGLIGEPCKSAQTACRADRYSGWSGKDAGATIQFSFTVPGYSKKRGLQSRSVVFATRTCGSCGAANVWLDDDYERRKYVVAKSSYSQTFLEIIGTHVKPGDHTMSVQIVTPGEVTAVAIMVGPPDGPY